MNVNKWGAVNAWTGISVEGGLLSETSVQSSITGSAAFFGYIISSATAQTFVSGIKEEVVVEASGTLLSLNVSDASVHGIKSAFGTFSATAQSRTTANGTADDLIFNSGYLVSSNANQTIVDGFKAALGILHIATSSTAATTEFLAMAAKHGVIVSDAHVTTLILGNNQDRDTLIRVLPIMGELQHYHMAATL
ncbi:MAG: hypothetical protein CSB48_02905 [Proteobacteria bacterium]|nr:MAG: hypothetical protein CSB48_02905 [Pseudomonadota bacterium]